MKKRRTLAIKLRAFGVRSFTPNQFGKTEIVLLLVRLNSARPAVVRSFRIRLGRSRSRLGRRLCLVFDGHYRRLDLAPGLSPSRVVSVRVCVARGRIVG